MGFSGKVRPCWKCKKPISFLPTSTAPRGAWVDGHSQVHHRCNHQPPAPLGRKLPLAPRVTVITTAPVPSLFPASQIFFNKSIRIAGMNDRFDYALARQHKAIIKASVERAERLGLGIFAGRQSQ